MVAFQCPDNYFLLEILRIVHASIFGEFLGMKNEMSMSPRLVIEYGNGFVELPSKEIFFGDLVFPHVFLFLQTILFSLFLSIPPISY